MPIRPFLQRKTAMNPVSPAKARALYKRLAMVSTGRIVRRINQPVQ
jgi:hypothetical protein